MTDTLDPEKRPLFSRAGLHVLNLFLVFPWVLIFYSNLFAFSGPGMGPPLYGVLLILLAIAHLTYPVALIISWFSKKAIAYPILAIAMQFSAVIIGYMYVAMFS